MLQSLRADSTSMDAMNRIMECIRVADAEDYMAWEANNPDAKRKTLSNLVGHVQSAMKQIVQSYAEQFVEKRVTLGILISLMLVKCDQHHASSPT